MDTNNNNYFFVSTKTKITTILFYAFCGLVILIGTEGTLGNLSILWIILLISIILSILNIYYFRIIIEDRIITIRNLFAKKTIQISSIKYFGKARTVFGRIASKYSIEYINDKGNIEYYGIFPMKKRKELFELVHNKNQAIEIVE